MLLSSARTSDLYHIASSLRNSTGCENCRRAKKSCDRTRPTCGRCVRLGHACLPGCDEAAYSAAPGTSPATHPPAPENADVVSGASSVTAVHDSQIHNLERVFSNAECWSMGLLERHDLMRLSLAACVALADANSTGESAVRHIAVTLYARALQEMASTLGDAVRAREDVPIAAAMVLCFFERLNTCDTAALSNCSTHVEGLIRLVDTRGRLQLRTKVGRGIFRKARQLIIDNALWRQQEPPVFVFLWTQALTYDDKHSIGDQLAIFEARCARLWREFHTDAFADEKLLENALSLEKDLENWGLTNKPQSWLQSPMDTKEEDLGPESDHWWKMCWHICRVDVANVLESLISRISRQPDDRMQEIACTISALRQRTAILVHLSARQQLGETKSTLNLKACIEGALYLVRPLYVAAYCVTREVDKLLLNSTLAYGATSAELPCTELKCVLLQQLLDFQTWLNFLSGSLGDRCAAEALSLLCAWQARYQYGLQ